jgi:hypothetical protein
MSTFSNNRKLYHIKDLFASQVKAVLSRVGSWLFPPKKAKLAFPSFMVLSIFFLSGCSSYQYYSIQNEHIPLNKYHTFAWLPPVDTLKRDGYTDIADEKIKDETTDQLEKRGLLLKAANPDLLVRYSIGVNNKVKLYEEPVYTYADGFYPGVVRYRHGRYFYYSYRRPFVVYVGSEIERIPYKEGTLIIDLIDRRTSYVIWRGYGIGEIVNPEKAIHDIPEVVEGIINKLPLKPIGR